MPSVFTPLNHGLCHSGKWFAMCYVVPWAAFIRAWWTPEFLPVFLTVTSRARAVFKEAAEARVAGPAAWQK